MRKLILFCMTVTAVLGLSGCNSVGSVEQYAEKLLEKRYGEEFTVEFKIESQAPIPGVRYVGIGYPEENEDLVFSVNSSNGDTINEDYESVVISGQLKDYIESVIEEYTDDYSLGVNMTHSVSYNQEDCKEDRLSDITLEGYSEVYDEEPYFSFVVGVNEEDSVDYKSLSYDIEDELNNLYTPIRYSLYVVEVPEDDMDEFEEEISDGLSFDYKKHIQENYNYEYLELE